MQAEEAYNAHGIWPSSRQELLLRAALATGTEACDAFGLWQSGLDIDGLDGASVRLLPLLYRNLLDQDVRIQPRLLDRLRGVYRQAWYRNQLLLAVVAEVVDRFNQASVPAVLLKGVPLAVHYYPSIGSRPMTDADILVRPEHADRALQIARAAGLVPKFSPGEWPPRLTASKPFVHPSGWEFDLHTNVMHECRGKGRDNAMWAGAVPATVNGIPALTLAPEDHLVHAIAHGVWRNPLPPIRWVADAVMLVRTRGDAFDWPRVLRETRERRLTLLARRALRYLRDRMALGIPDAVLAELEREVPTLTERFEYRARMWSGAVGLAATRVSDYMRARGREPDWAGPLGLVHYVRDSWDLTSSWLVPVTAYRKSVRRITGRRQNSELGIKT
jgi:hypothetical protein